MSVSKLASLARYPYYGACLRRYLTSPTLNLTYQQNRRFAEKKVESSVAEANPASDVSTDVRPLGEKIKETAKTASYTGIIAVGLGITGIIFYNVFRELFSSKSPNSIYSAALEKCIQDPYVEEALGPPIKGFGEESSRRRRNHVSHAFYERDGVNCIRMQFYIKGIRNKATVQLDMKEVDGKFEYRYLLVQLDDYTHKVIVLEDNRASIDKKPLAIENMGTLPSIL